MVVRTVDARRERERPPVLVVVVIAAAWLVAMGAELSGRAGLLGHDHLVEGGLPVAAALGLFLVAWLVMFAAMMLPSSLSMQRTFRQVTANLPHTGWMRAVFGFAYVATWVVFGFAALAGDGLLHRTVDAHPWLADHAFVIGAAVLIGAGAFQYTELKERCLTQCRTPLGFLLQRFRPGIRGAFRVGLAHAVFCIGCCWALMLVAFAAGMSNLVWMATIATIMTIERTVSWGASAVRPVGWFLIVLGVVVLLHPPGLPIVLGVG